MLFARPLRVFGRDFRRFVLLSGVIRGVCLFCCICVVCVIFAWSFECYVRIFHNFSRLLACPLHYVCTHACHLSNQEPFRLLPPQVWYRLMPQRTCERPVLSPHLGPLCLGLFNLSLQGHQLGLKPALRSGEVRSVERWEGAGREEVKFPLFPLTLFGMSFGSPVAGKHTKPPAIPSGDCCSVQVHCSLLQATGCGNGLALRSDGGSNSSYVYTH